MKSEVTVSHILVAYKGAERADSAVTRTEDEAKNAPQKFWKNCKRVENLMNWQNNIRTTKAIKTGVGL